MNANDRNRQNKCLQQKIKNEFGIEKKKFLLT